MPPSLSGRVQAAQKKCLLGAHAALVTDQAELLTGPVKLNEAVRRVTGFLFFGQRSASAPASGLAVSLR
jgi:hypothetical protein